MAEPASKGKIIEAAWTLLTEVGFGQFSMRKLAKEVGITASTLYWHFSSKEAIFTVMADDVCGEALNAFMAASTWQEQLVSDGLVFADTLRKRPYSADLLFTIPPITEHFLKVNERFLKTIDDLSLADSEKFIIVNIYLDYILTFERDRQVRQHVFDSKEFQDVQPNGDLITQTPVLKRMYGQGIFDRMDRDSTLKWSLETLVKGFEQRQK
ncbi:MAG: TetR/AcrR family transcriptional regulator [Furfurilactobacillus sp.]|jgi:AcrR family transcriptional regulator|uniref:TetR/AcrR family transcriptional regulator n=2 Tax=Furfurilactobacillus TaxID=2767882 RepID=A0ABT6DAB1_9LACO|nr:MULTISPECIES: helix-turn-helix domain-containing protein [Furfurilactobacillus]QLE65389.1 transcriptional regulator TetR [Furfurilactobacillus rossiae]MCF6160889.1 TetR/AcrR family transcriptional regulator [Furfurilactobacillus milii]MCF6163345.1 TetR/AcrR family transcriptional regulator [Furfurilactobacillus milii]MCH4011906.1 TetR/AcrR family transcriptional regulator [Furfurilactobacillus sp.]MCH4037798.1 TetR/AcrR family transcriptional regulator [Furfurilactobacillus sp.]